MSYYIIVLLYYFVTMLPFHINYHIMMYCIVLCSIQLYWNVLVYIMLHHIIYQFILRSYDTIWYLIIPYYTMLYLNLYLVMNYYKSYIYHKYTLDIHQISPFNVCPAQHKNRNVVAPEYKAFLTWLKASRLGWATGAGRFLTWNSPGFALEKRQLHESNPGFLLCFMFFFANRTW